MDAKQKELLPGLVAAFLLVPPKETPQANLRKVLGLLGEEAQAKVYELCSADLLARLDVQIDALKAQRKEIAHAPHE